MSQTTSRFAAVCFCLAPFLFCFPFAYPPRTDSAKRPLAANCSALHTDGDAVSSAQNWIAAAGQRVGRDGATSADLLGLRGLRSVDVFDVGPGLLADLPHG